jgi:hypothetical protein
MMNAQLEQDWIKLAAQTYSDRDVEKAFLDQAYMFIENKAKPLMEAPHRLGFEIVFKNDANSKMAGIFAFRVVEELLYAPVFFINGSIKGTDLLYRHKTKSFVPNTSEWASYIIGLYTSESGGPIDKRDTQHVNETMSFRKLSYPPQYSQGFKFASYQEIADLNPGLPSAKDMYMEILDKTQEVLNERKEASFLRKFILEDGGFNAIEKLANSIDADEEFAGNMAYYVGAENFLPKEMIQQRKSASTKHEVKLHIGALHKSASAGAKEDGYSFEDNRPDGMKVKTVYESGAVAGVDGWGVYDILTTTGKPEKCLVATSNHMNLQYPRSSEEDYLWETPTSGRGGRPNRNIEVWVRSLENPMSETNESMSDLVAMSRETVVDGDIPKYLKGKFSDKPSANKIYRMLDISSGPQSGSVSGEFGVLDVSTEEGVTRINVTSVWCIRNKLRDMNDASCSTDDDFQVVVLNPSFAGNDYEANAFHPDKVLFIEVPVERASNGSRKNSFRVASPSSAFQLVESDGIKSASVRLQNGEYVFSDFSGTSGHMGKLASLCTLMGRYGFTEELSRDVVKTASERGFLEFIYPVVKTAHNLSFQDIPDFLEDVDEDFGLPLERPQSITITADSTDPDMPVPRIGDSIRFDNAASIGTRGPNELAQLSESADAPQLFEHGVVGNLINTYDSSLMIDKYLPDLEAGLDKIGRLLFLFYWKPEDFSDLYGENDQATLENMFISNFKSFGDMVLELLKKRKAYVSSVGSA